MVFNHPWFAVPDEDGRFELPAVPPGDREITAWHERLGDTTLPSARRVAAVLLPPTSSFPSPNSETAAAAGRPHAGGDLRHRRHHSVGGLHRADGRRARPRSRGGNREAERRRRRCSRRSRRARQQEQLAAIATARREPDAQGGARHLLHGSAPSTGLPAEQEQSLRDTVTRRSGEAGDAAPAPTSLAILDASGRIFASAGPSRRALARRTSTSTHPGRAPTTFQDIAVAAAGRVPRLRRRRCGLLDRDIGALVLGTSLDAQLRRASCRTSPAPTSSSRVNGVVVGRARCRTKSPRDLVAAGTRRRRHARRSNGEEYAVRTLLAIGSARGSTRWRRSTPRRATATRDALMALATVAFGASCSRRSAACGSRGR